MVAAAIRTIFSQPTGKDVRQQVDTSQRHALNDLHHSTGLYRPAGRCIGSAATPPPPALL
ncbi:hypothetical protein [Rhodococcus jostii]|uniref:hypothetical protein n=1 Tax=Rhodococcus jostii TaxID=132919 RepID=UPI00363165B1